MFVMVAKILLRWRKWWWKVCYGGQGLEKREGRKKIYFVTFCEFCEKCDNDWCVEN